MRNLQGQLADYNLMLDRNRIHKNVEDILDECRQLEGANASERHRVDELLTHRQHLEGQGREVEQQLHAHNQEMGRRLESVEPAMQQHFLELQAHRNPTPNPTPNPHPHPSHLLDLQARLQPKPNQPVLTPAPHPHHSTNPTTPQPHTTTPRLWLQDLHEKLTVHELPKKQADLNYFGERCAEMEHAMAQDPGRGTLVVSYRASSVS